MFKTIKTFGRSVRSLNVPLKVLFTSLLMSAKNINEHVRDHIAECSVFVNFLFIAARNHLIMFIFALLILLAVWSLLLFVFLFIFYFTRSIDLHIHRTPANQNLMKWPHG